jgi:hypothetical protein
MTQLKQGMLVEHPSVPEWGPGKIVTIEGDYLHVVFRDLPGRQAKQFKMGTIAFIKAAVQHDDILDNLPPLTKEGEKYVFSMHRLTLKEALDMFDATFPLGFEDPKYLEAERNYKWAAHEKFQELLGDGKGRALLDEEKFSEYSKNLLTVASKVNLLSVFEKAALRDALKEHEDPGVKKFLFSLQELLEDPTLTSTTYENLLHAATELPQKKTAVATWPVVTLFPFLAQPDRHMFLKPDVTKKASDRLAFNLNYESTPNWKTYSCLLKMGEIYRDKISHLKPRDFIDVQSFIWVTGAYPK